MEDDREALDGHDAAGLPADIEPKGQALAYKTIEGYLSGIAELHRNQVNLLLSLIPQPSLKRCGVSEVYRIHAELFLAGIEQSGAANLPWRGSQRHN